MYVLLVEDTPEQAQIIECYLEMALPDVEIDAAGSLTETLVALEKFTYDAILLDLGLPDVQGVTTVAEVHQTTPNTPIIVLTSAGENGLGLLCLQAGAQDFLDKSNVTPAILQKALSFATARKSEETQLWLQRELDAIREIDPGNVTDFEKGVRDIYKGYLLSGSPSLSMARRVIRDLFKKGVRSRDFLSLHVVSLEELSQSVESDRLKEVAGKSCYLALAIMTVVSQLANRKAKKVAS